MSLITITCIVTLVGMNKPQSVWFEFDKRMAEELAKENGLTYKKLKPKEFKDLVCNHLEESLEYLE